MVFEILFFLILSSSIVLVILENRRPAIAIFWVTMLILLPVVGLVLYILFGKDHRSSRVIKPDELQRLATLRDDVHSDSIIDRPDNDKYTKLAALLLSANDAPLFVGNNVRIFTDFTPMFQTLLDDIAAARRYVHIQFYKIENDEVGRQLADLMVKKAQEGVDVRLMYDSFANLFVRPKYYKMMRNGGVKVQPFLKFLPSIFSRDVNCRTHRKIVVVDGTIGYTGGMNVARRYRDGIKQGAWRDTHIRIHGPAVSQLEVALLSDWRFCTKELLADPCFFPDYNSPIPDSQMQIVTSGPMDSWDTVMQGMVQAIAQSQHHIWIQSPYFIPTEPILLALRNAALAGVDVRLMIPSTGDRGMLMLRASESYFQDVMQAGIKVYLYQSGYLHAKTMLCDDDFVTIGSTNIDHRSMGQNFEVNAFIYDPTVALRQRDIFLDDLSQCTLVDPAQWRRRPIGKRFIQGIARLLTPLL